jgi:hypothetical protein
MWITVGTYMDSRKSAWIFETKADVHPEVFLWEGGGGLLILILHVTYV